MLDTLPAYGHVQIGRYAAGEASLRGARQAPALVLRWMLKLTQTRPKVTTCDMATACSCSPSAATVAPPSKAIAPSMAHNLEFENTDVCFLRVLPPHALHCHPVLLQCFQPLLCPGVICLAGFPAEQGCQ